MPYIDGSGHQVVRRNTEPLGITNLPRSHRSPSINGGGPPERGRGGRPGDSDPSSDLFQRSLLSMPNFHFLFRFLTGSLIHPPSRRTPLSFSLFKRQPPKPKPNSTEKIASSCSCAGEAEEDDDWQPKSKRLSIQREGREGGGSYFSPPSSSSHAPPTAHVSPFPLLFLLTRPLRRPLPPSSCSRNRRSSRSLRRHPLLVGSRVARPQPVVRLSAGESSVL